MKLYTDLNDEEWADRFGCPCGEWVPLRWGDPSILMEEMKVHQMMHTNFPPTVGGSGASPGPVEKGPDTFEPDLPKKGPGGTVMGGVVINQPIGSGGGLTRAEEEAMATRRRSTWRNS